MHDDATLFDLGRRPTTREVADAVRTAGLGGLPSAVRRGDDVLYQEVVCRTALNRVEDMLFRWTLNPYRGCTHGCHFCFARRYQAQLELGPGDEFSSVVLVKTNFADVLADELRRPGWNPQNDAIALGTATDPYQPIEGRYRLTRRALSALIAHPTPLGIITRGPLAVRDIDLLAERSRLTRCTVTFSIPTVDDVAWRRLEPGTAHPLQRLRAVRQLCRAGVDAGVLMAPIDPGISSHPAILDRTIRVIQDHGAAFVGALLLYVDGATREHFFGFLGRAYPHLVERHGRLYADKHPSASYHERFRAVMGALQAKYDIRTRADSGEREQGVTPSRPAAHQQQLRLGEVA